MAEATVARREELLAAAEKLFAERGFQATSVRDIAEALDIQAGSLYAHIASKDDLLWEILCAAAERFFAAVEAIVAQDLVTLEKLRRVIAAHVQVITSNLAAAAVYSTEWRHLSQARRREFASRRNRYEEIVRGLVRACIREGTFTDVDEKFATLVILSATNWIYQWYRPDGAMSAEEIARKLTDLLLNGLKRAGT
ncbi:MAG: TetR/AcrR family transcriptional regulator [Planctomycetes bacterium]|nr:TetR/AcrR family transcriptional regulator [Planctomycetota bacterium]